ncbi:MAG: GNAT family N-acetyltransferase [Gammaproteobacteria bacterium]|nr:GNAT family N-acetyltransferase [Gammaproteobacteria bacterium]
MLIDSFETSRLQAKRLSSNNYGLLRQIHTDVSTMETLGGIRTEEQTLENLQWNLKQWEECNIGLWLFFEKETKQFIGTAGLRHIDIEGALEVDLAYVLLSQFWHRGYGTEMGKACLNIGFDKYKFESIVAGTRSTNFSSQKVIDKLGFSFERAIFKFGHEQFLYRLTKNEFHQTQNN